MQPTQKFDSIISAIDMHFIYEKVSKQSQLGAPTALNYPAMIISIFIRYVERIPIIKDLVKRLKDNIAFKLNCGFLVSDAVPSEASYSRVLTKLSELDVLEAVQERLSLSNLKYQTMDASYGYEAIYQQVYQMGQQSIIAYNKRNESEPIGFDKHFAPTCFREHFYRYDSYDAKYETLK